MLSGTLVRRAFSIGAARPIVLIALAALSLAVAPSFARAQQLDLSWTDNSGGQAGFIIQRAPAISGPFAQIAQVAAGVVSYTDTTVSSGSTYCYQVAAFNSAGTSAFTNPACGTPSAGITLTTAKTGTGSGTVSSSPAGINCGSACSSTFPPNRAVTLTATPANGSNFTSWSGGGCGGSVPSCTLVGNVPASVTATFDMAPVNPAPTLASLSPNSALQGGAAFTLTVTGSGFVAASAVQWNSSPRATTFVSATQLSASIPASDLATAGPASVAVVSPAPGGGTSSSVAFTITAVNPSPALSSLSPSSALQNGAAFTLTVTGSGFVPASTVQWNGSSRPTTFVSATQLTASIPAGDLASAGSPAVTVTTPAPGGGTSSAIAFTVTGVNPAPVLSSLSPGSAQQNGAAFTLTVAGSGFVPTSVIQWNGSSRTTTFVSATQLTASIPAGDLASAGSPAVTVATPAPGGGTSGALAFTVTAVNPAPVLSSLSPSSVPQNQGAFTLTVTGSGFVPASVVQLNGSSRTTTFVSATQLTAQIPASDLGTAGAISVTVVTPAPGGGTSNPQTLTVSGPSLTVSGTTAAPGSAVTVTLSNGLGATYDFLDLAPVGSANSAYVQWTYVGAGVTTRTWTVTMPATGGPYEFRLFYNNTLTRLATSPAVTVANAAPTLGTLAPASVAAGSGGFALTVTGTGFVSGTTATVGGQARAVSGVTATQLTIAVTAADVATVGTVPVVVSNPGPCTGGCSSTSAPLTVLAPPPAPVLSSLSPATLPLGSGAFTLTATGQNFTATSVVRVNGASRPTTFLSATQLTAQIPASDLGSAGAISVTVVTPAPGGGTSNPQTLTVSGPSLAVSGTTAAPGSAVTVTLSNGLGTTYDWLGLAPVGSADTTYLQWTYVGAGVTTRTWTVTMPATVGPYEFRLYYNNGYTRLATSPPVAVQ